MRTLLRLESGNADRISSYCCRLRVQQVLGEHDLLLQGGEAVEFDTRVPHWFDRAGPEAVELLSLLGLQGERVHVGARPARNP